MRSYAAAAETRMLIWLPLAADNTDIILIRLGTPLDVDRRLLQSSR
jgi:hypothetical protein